ncbi:hypothetical protein J2Y67_001389 [Neobacillus niacini]|nr:hypothetical protein [Neobacillus niacini]
MQKFDEEIWEEKYAHLGAVAAITEMLYFALHEE